MKNIIKELKSLETLPYKCNFDEYSKYNLQEANQFLLEEAGKEHYQLLAYLSEMVNDKIFFDVGTYRGTSGLALGHNKTNKVYSYDIVNNMRCIINEPNIEYIIGDATKNDNLLNSGLILLDTAHDGGYESRFLKYLKDNKYNGVVLMDDVNLYPVLMDLANQLKERNVVELIDLTKIGHWSGTLALLFQ